MRFFALFVLAALGGFTSAFGQGLENVLLETYYVSDANDATDSDGGELVEGSVTYRIYIDMAPGYELQAVYGNENHELRIETSTYFFNNEDRGEITGDVIPANRLDENTVAVDSWVTMGAASEDHFGLLKTEDGNGSIVGGVNNDGGSEGIASGLLANENLLAGISLTTSDGLLEGNVPAITVVGLDLGVFSDANDGPIFSSNGGAWSVLDGAQGPTIENKILIAQITTDGLFSFSLNIQLGTPDGNVEQYVSSTPIGNEQFFNALNFPLLPVPGCTSDTACNFNSDADEDDGSCLEPILNCTECNEVNDGLILIDSDADGVCDAEEIVGCSAIETACNYNPETTDEVDCLEPLENCAECNADGTGLILVDSDGDGICDAEELAGCTNETACNFNELATNDDGNCIVPEENCTSCNANNDALELIDSDGDGICDALENPGCLSETACNYNLEASSDDGSCLEPIENCSICNGENNELILIDTDDDGICDAEEIIGCQNESACNYNPEATDEADCIEPVENCSECNEDNTDLLAIDTDDDGICDADEVLGCASETACNYNVLATDDDESCIEPEEDCFECNENNDGLIIIDADGDGVCDGEEVLGCTDPNATNYNLDATEDDGSCDYIDNIVELSKNIQFSVFPNPTYGEVFISANAITIDRVKCTVFNILGEQIHQEILHFNSEDLCKLSLDGFSSGMYFIEVLSGTYRTTKRVIKK